MFAHFKRFDVHVKAVDGVNQQTVLGALITLLSAALVIMLLLSEVTYFSKIDVVSRMLADNTAGVEAVRLEFDIEFFDVSCDRVSFLQEVTRGTLHVREPGLVEKFSLDDGINLGCHIRGSTLIDKVGGNFRFGVEPLSTDKISNISHTINHVAFLPTIKDSASSKLSHLSPSLSQQVSIVSEETGIYQYAVQVVPTQYKTLYGDLSYANQYSVVEKEVSIEQLKRSGVVSGLHLKDFQGLLFTYDFHPVMLYMEERREKIIDFVSNLFGIVGGVITILSLLEGLLHQSTKVLIGKND